MLRSKSLALPAVLALLAAACSSSGNGAKPSTDGGTGNDAAGPGDDAGSEASDAANPPPDSGGSLEAGSDDGGSDGGPQTITTEVTFYGWDDNSPPGNGISFPQNGGYPTIHNAAGGTGTYADPVTFATDQAEFAPGTILYVPYVQKYVVMEDDCAQCDTDWGSGAYHIDIWMNSDGTENPQDLTNCADAWTRSSAPVTSNPPANLPVTTTPLFDPSTNTCQTPPP